MNRNRLLMIGFIALAMGAFVSFAGLQESAVRPRSTNAAPGEEVLVAADDLQVGTKIEEKDVRFVRFPSSDLPAGVFHFVNKVVGRGVVLPISKGEFILTNKLAGENAGAGLPGLIPPGMRAVSVRVNDTTSVSGFVLPGTHVDVLLTGNPGGSNEQQTTTVLENLAVIATGQKLERNAAGEPQTTPVITLLVSPDDAQKLTLASNQGKIQLALRNPLDTKQEELAAARADSLYEITAAPVPSAPARSRPRQKPSVAPRRPHDACPLHRRDLERRQEGRGQVLSATPGSRSEKMSICSAYREEPRDASPSLLLRVVERSRFALCPAAVASQDQAASPPAPACQPSSSRQEGPQASAQAPAESEAGAPLRVMVGKSILINTTERIRRVSVTDAAVADPQVISPTQILVHGKSAGEVSLLIWDELERSRSFDLARGRRRERRR